MSSPLQSTSAVHTGPVSPADAPTRTLATREIYRNKWTRLREDSILHANGQPGIYGVIEKDPACIVIPLEHTEDGTFVTLVHQFRYTVQGSYFELPQGGWEVAAPDFEALARGELREETGLTAARMTPLGTNWIAYGAMRQRHDVWLAEGLSQGASDLEPEETGLTVHRVLVDEFERMMLDGRIMDNCTLAAWATYLVWTRHRGNGPQPSRP